MSLRNSWKNIRRRMLSPFKRIEYKFKTSVQKLIVKALEQSSAKAGAGGAMHLESGHLLLSLLKASRRHDHIRPSPLQAVAVGEYLLTTHPTAEYCYLLPLDQVTLPRMLTGNYQPNVTAWIYSQLQNDDRVLLLGGSQGYHALSLASKLHTAGSLHIVPGESSEETRALRLNFQSRDLQNVSVDSETCERVLADAQALNEQIEQFQPTVVFMEGIDPQRVAALANLSHQVCFAIVQNEEVSALEGLPALHSPAAIREAA